MDWLECTASLRGRSGLQLCGGLSLSQLARLSDAGRFSGRGVLPSRTSNLETRDRHRFALYTDHHKLTTGIGIGEYRPGYQTSTRLRYRVSATVAPSARKTNESGGGGPSPPNIYSHHPAIVDHKHTSN